MLERWPSLVGLYSTLVLSPRPCGAVCTCGRTSATGTISRSAGWSPPGEAAKRSIQGMREAAEGLPVRVEIDIGYGARRACGGHEVELHYRLAASAGRYGRRESHSAQAELSSSSASQILICEAS